ncbi:MAG: hypothetical protein WCP28_12620 [Actinomycetes bacterium]
MSDWPIQKHRTYEEHVAAGRFVEHGQLENAKAAEHVMNVLEYGGMEEPDAYHRELIKKLMAESPPPDCDDPDLPYINAVNAYLAGGDRILERMYEDGL